MMDAIPVDVKWHKAALPFVCLCLSNATGSTVSSHQLLAFAIGSLVVFLPAIYTQVKLGSAYRANVVQLFPRLQPITLWVAMALMLRLLLVLVFVTPSLTFRLREMAFATSTPFVWASCANSWNTDRCRSYETPAPLPTNDSVFPDPPSGYEEYDYYLYPDDVYYDEADPRDMHNITWEDEGIFSSPVDEFLRFIYGETGDIGLGPVNPVLKGALCAIWILIFIAVGFGAGVLQWFAVGLGGLTLIFLLCLVIHSFTIPSGGAYQHLGVERVNTMYSALGMVHSCAGLYGLLPTLGKFSRMGTRGCVVTSFLGVGACILTPCLMYLIQANHFGSLTQLYLPRPTSDSYNIRTAFALNHTPPEIVLLYHLTHVLLTFLPLMFSVFVLTEWVSEAIPKRLWRDVPFGERAQHLLITAAFCVILFLLGIAFTCEGGYSLISIFDAYTWSFDFILASISMVTLGLLYVFNSQQRAWITITVSIWCVAAAILVCAFIGVHTLSFPYPQHHYDDIDGAVGFGLLLGLLPLVLGVVVGVSYTLCWAHRLRSLNWGYLLCGPCGRSRGLGGRRADIIMLPSGNGCAGSQPLQPAPSFHLPAVPEEEMSLNSAVYGRAKGDGEGGHGSGERDEAAFESATTKM